MKFIFLADKKEMKAKVARWYFDEWGPLVKGATVESFDRKLDDYLNSNQIPLIVMAVDGEKVLGVAQLRCHEMSIYPDKEYWIGGVYVDSEFRGNNVASSLILKVQEVALSLDVEKIHLQTEKLNGGLYAHLGWKALEQVNYRGVDVLVMSKSIKH